MKLDPLQRYTPPPYTKKCFTGLQSRASLSNSDLLGRQGRHAHAYGICAPFYCISLKQKLYGGGISLPRVWFQGTLPFLDVKQNHSNNIWINFFVCVCRKQMVIDLDIKEFFTFKKQLTTFVPVNKMYFCTIFLLQMSFEAPIGHFLVENLILMKDTHISFTVT